MPLILPNLDDRRWSDLVEEARGLIPVYSPEWTDHNVHDPGITLIELLAWITEMDIYHLNQVPDRHKRKFLELVGVLPQAPQAARAILHITPVDKSAPLTLAAGMEFCGKDAFEVETRFRTLNEITVVPGFIQSLELKDATGFHDLTPAWTRGDTLQIFGAAPVPGTEFYVGLSAALPPGIPVRFYFMIGDGHSGPQDACRLRREAEQQSAGCVPPANPCSKAAATPAPKNAPQPEILRHYGVRTVWEFAAASAEKAQWMALDEGKMEVSDETRAFTLDGYVTMQIPAAMGQHAPGSAKPDLYYLRCRFDGGMYDAPPTLREVRANSVVVEQAVPAGSSFPIARGATVELAPQGAPKPGDAVPLRLTLDSQNRITWLSFIAATEADPVFFIHAFRAPTDTTVGWLSFEAVLLGTGTGMPNQHVTIREVPAQESSLELLTMEDKTWQRWVLRPDFDASSRTDRHFRLDPTSGEITFGKGAKGLMAPANALIFAKYRSTRADAGNLAACKITQLADSTHNHALMTDRRTGADTWSQTKSLLRCVSNHLPAAGGNPAEELTHAEGRAVTVLESSARAVTLTDYESRALETPGTRIARVKAIANQHPDFPCFSAPGVVALIIVPYLPAGQPYPTAGLRGAVAGYLRRRRVIGTRLEIAGPTYLQVTVQAKVQSVTSVNRTVLQSQIVAALNQFFDPLGGGPDGTGWPFGRDVYRAEVMKVIDEVDGVDHILSMNLLGAGCEPVCGNICLGPTCLVASGKHQITVS
jgi:Baseplate J-like protein